MIRAALFTALACAAGLVSGPASARDLQPVRDLDLQRYAGVWHEIARLPNRFEDDCVGDITATYTPREDGSIRVVNACRKEDGEIMSSDGEARRTGDNPAQLEVRFAPKWLSFLPFVWADYWVIALDDDYQWALVGEPDRKYLWILARQPRLDADTFEGLKARARGLGYELDGLVVVNPPKPASED
ncbi:lipocalin family protein [Arenimonas sp.]|uniref:lipocalin family protein n=1 Tax=Arenimonas sp. TaxID=1872635 RepID=UPI0035ADFBEE